MQLLEKILESEIIAESIRKGVFERSELGIFGLVDAFKSCDELKRGFLSVIDVRSTLFIP